MKTTNFRELMKVIELTRLERYDLALERLTALLTEYPDDEEVHFYFGYVLVKKKEFRQAEKAIERAIALKPDYDEAYSLMAVVCDELNDLKMAEKWLMEAIKLAPTEPEYYAQLASIYFYYEKYTKASELLKTGLEHDPENEDCHLLMYRIYRAQGRDAEAAEILENTLSKNPENVEALAQMGYRLNDKGQHQEARETFKSIFSVGREQDIAVKGLLQTAMDDHRLNKLLSSEKIQTYLAASILLGTPFLFFAWLADTNPPVKFYEYPVLMIGQMCSFALATFSTVKFFLFISRPNTRVEFEKGEIIYASLSTLFFIGSIFLWFFIFGRWFQSIPISRDWTLILFYSILLQISLAMRSHVYRPKSVFKAGMPILIVLIAGCCFVPALADRKWVILITFLVVALDYLLYFGKIWPRHTFSARNY